MADPGPLETILRTKVWLVASSFDANRQITNGLRPTRLEVYNDSKAHAHHAAMRGATSQETHFRLVIVSEVFQTMRQPERHRTVYRLLNDELEAGLHALQLRTLTADEDSGRN